MTCVGIGRSRRPDAPFSHSRDLAVLLKFLKIDRGHFIGLSVGGAIAIDFAIEYPEKAMVWFWSHQESATIQRRMRIYMDSRHSQQ
jgi:pimeloyl-ACP methyl ester carboxylesterase